MVNPAVHVKLNPLLQLHKLGQSVWYAGLRRGLIVSGELGEMIEHEGIAGATVSLPVLASVIAGSPDYDDKIRVEIRQGKDISAIYESLVVADVQAAADLLRSVFETSHGLDGYVCLDVSPYAVGVGEEIIEEAKRVYTLIGRKNVMIRIPATQSGIASIEHLVAQGVNINIGPISSIDSYKQVIEAYLSGLEKVVRRGGTLGHIASVASWSVVPVDRAVEAVCQTPALMPGCIEEVSGGLSPRRTDLKNPVLKDGVSLGQDQLKSAKEQEPIGKLVARAAIANASAAYQVFEEVFANDNCDRWKLLLAKGAKPQRLMWVDTICYNPSYRTTLYVEELIGQNTITCLTPATLVEFRRQGIVQPTLEARAVELLELKGQLMERGISLADTTFALQEQQGEDLAEAMDHVLGAIEEKREAIVSRQPPKLRYSLGVHKDSFEALISEAKRNQLVTCLWQKESAIWSGNDEDRWLGWLDIVDNQLMQVELFQQIGEEMREGGFKYALVIGMGGSSLSVEVLKRTFGVIDQYPEVFVLDSVVPAQVLSVEKKLDLSKTLFVVSSKSGSTTEPNVLNQYFFNQVKQVVGDNAGLHFVAITDPGSSLERLAHEHKFRQVFYGMPSIGGRYSALSNFGIVPAAIMGLDVARFLHLAQRMVHASAPCIAVHDNEGVVLGAIMGALARQRCDKVTIVASPAICSLGLWLEQLIAESTGKDGVGIIPIDGEKLSSPQDYGNDRLFVYVRLVSRADSQQDKLIDSLEAAGHPVVRIDMDDTSGLGAEFFRWEIATAVAGAVLRINPFDQPNVQESKDNTKKFLAEYVERGTLPQDLLVCEGDGIKLYSDETNKSFLDNAVSESTIKAYLSAHCERLQPGDYFAVNAYVESLDTIHTKLQAVRHKVRDGWKVATTLGYGPRFLHSTGQLHKGGPNSGVFLQITCDDSPDVPIPGEKYTFGILKQAQSFGDFLALSKRNRRALRVHLGTNIADGLDRLLEVI